MSEQPPPSGQNPYQPNPYGHGAYDAMPFLPPDHPQSTMVLILGILGLAVCQVLSPVAWVMGGNALREIDASGGRLGGRSAVNAGRICGMVGTVLLIIGVAVAVIAIVLALVVPLALVGSTSS